MLRRWDDFDKPQVLEYRTSPPPPPLKQALLNIPEQIIEACGGLNWLLFSISLCFMALGIFGMVPCLLIWAILLDRWSKSSKWF